MRTARGKISIEHPHALSSGGEGNAANRTDDATEQEKLCPCMDLLPVCLVEFHGRRLACRVRTGTSRIPVFPGPARHTGNRL